MKRPLGIIGLTYLFMLAVIFYCYSFVLVVCICAGAVVASLIAVIIRFVRRKSSAHLSIIAASISVLAAVLSIFLYQNNKVTPIISSYADREIEVEGYICDELTFNKSFVTCVIQTEKINGESGSVKISYTMRQGYDMYPFDKIKVTLTPKESDYDYQKSKGIFLYAFEQDNANLTVTGEKHNSIRSVAFSVRKQMKQVLERSLDENGAALSEAVLLGDKHALPAEIKQAFYDTGTSYLIVVSGMHLILVTALLRMLLKLINAKPWISFTAIALFTFGFMAVTGFTPSVMRAGIMLLIVYFGKTVYRDADGINSLGVAALVLTLFNPYSVGNIGMLLSFAATFGILLWADPINAFILRALRLDKKQRHMRKKTFKTKAFGLLKKLIKSVIAFFATSLAATLWIIPVIILFFGKINPLTALFSMIAYPLTSAVLLLAMLLVLLSAFMPFFAFWGKVFAPPIDLFANLLTSAVKGFSKVPFASIPANDTYYYIWIAVSAVLVVCGYLFRAHREYVFSAIIISILTLTVGGSLTYLFADTSARLEIFRSGSGYTAVIRKENSASLLICNDTKSFKNELDIGRFDYVLLTGKDSRNQSIYSELSENNDISETIIYGKTSETPFATDDGVHCFGEGAEFSVVLNSDVSLKVISARGRVYQYLNSDSVSVLILPDKAFLRDLPREYLTADYAIIAGKVNDAELFECSRYFAVSETAVRSIEKADLISEAGGFSLRM